MQLEYFDVSISMAQYCMSSSRVTLYRLAAIFLHTGIPCLTNCYRYVSIDIIFV
jgi:hypothetical protein